MSRGSYDSNRLGVGDFTVQAVEARVSAKSHNVNEYEAPPRVTLVGELKRWNPPAHPVPRQSPPNSLGRRRL